MKRGILYFLILCGLSFEGPAFAKSYVYRNRANWVKLTKLSSKQLAGEVLSHPVQDITTDEMFSLLVSLKMSRGKLFKKEKIENEIFTEEEARKYAPLLVKALGEANPDQVVNMGIVHKRPFFVMRNDHISIINVFVQDREVHFYFVKLFAKLDGDYKQASRLDEAIHRAKGVRLSLLAQPGQVLSADGHEVIFNRDQLQALTALDLPPSIPPPSTESEDAVSRLKTLDQLKKDKLITDAEYQEKKTEILKGL